jgi:type I restriction enzyme, S subunit
VTLRVSPDEIVQRSTSPLLDVHRTWERVRLGEVADVLNGFAFKSVHFTKNGGVPLLRIRDVGQSETAVTYEGEYDERYLVQPGELIVGMDGDFRAARWGGSVALLNQRVCKVTVRQTDLYDETFLYYVLPGYLDAVHAFTSSVTVKHLSSRTVLDLPLPLPPLEEQRQIVAAIEEQFSRLDAATNGMLNVQRRLGGLARVVLDSSFSSISDQQPLGHFLREPLRNGHSAKASRDGKGVRTLTLTAVTRGEFIDANTKLTSADPSRVDDLWLSPGDIFIERSNTPDLVGTAALYLGPSRWAIFPDLLIRVRTTSNLVPEYLALYLRSNPARRYFKTRAQGIAGSMPKIDQHAVTALPVPVTSPEEQRRIVAGIEQQLSLVDALRASVDSAQTRSATLRRAILERAFRGELVPQDPHDEPSSLLLARVRAEGAATSKPTRPKRVTA